MKDFSVARLFSFKNEVFDEIKNAKYNVLEGMVYRMQLT